MNEKLKGILFGIISAICYGTNPLGALFLYEEGLNTNSIIFYRFYSILKFSCVNLKYTDSLKT